MASPRATIIRDLWLERRVSQQCASGSPEPLSNVEVPGWFKAVELGLAPDEGPSVFWVTASLPTINAAHRRILEGVAAPQATVRRQQRRVSAAQRRREVIRLERRSAKLMSRAGL